MRLNGWQRIGIVASVIWAIGAPIYMDSAAERDADEKFSWVHGSCRDVPSMTGTSASNVPLGPMRVYRAITSRRPTGPSSPWHLSPWGGLSHTRSFTW